VEAAGTVSRPSNESGEPTAALLTGTAPAGIAVILIRPPNGGADPAAPLRALFRARSGRTLPAELGDRVFYGDFVADGEVIDDVVVSRGPAGVEIHCHGGPAPAARILAALAGVGVRTVPGAPGMRWQAGAGAPAIRAEAMGVLPRVLTWPAAEILLAQSETALAAAARRARETGDPAALRSAVPLSVGRRLYEPPAVVIAGRPNAGKSTLANALFGRRHSLVSPEPGTTRDYVREPADLGGFAVWLIDTAGLRGTDEPIEREGVRRAHERISEADAVVAVLDGSRPLEPEDARLRLRFANDPRVVWVRNKSDLPPAWGEPALPAVAISAERETGLEELVAAVLGRLGLAGLTPATPVVFTPRQDGLIAAALSARDGGARSAALDELLDG
jgi:tRNA modification GTPase